MQTTRTTVVAIGLAAMCAAGLTAQTQKTKTTMNTKVEIKGGTDTTAVGCLERLTGGDYILTALAENRGAEPARDALVTSDDLSKHVGERVQIQGKAVTNGHGKVAVESTTKTEVEDGKDEKTKTKTEGTTGVLDMPLLSVKSMKTLASSCR